MDLALPLLLRGGQVVLGASRGFDPQSTAGDDRRRGAATVIPIYPTMLRRVLATPVDPSLDLSSLRLIITGGEAAPLPVIRGTVERFPGVAFVNNYGSTEGGPITTFLPAEDSLRKIGSVGREAFSVQVRIEDDGGQPLRRRRSRRGGGAQPVRLPRLLEPARPKPPRRSATAGGGPVISAGATTKDYCGLPGAART